jgi:hypothetical protein
MKIVNGIFSGILGFLLTVILITLGGIITLENTILNPAFIISEMEKLDAYSIIADEISLQLKDQLPTEVPYVEETIDETITELEPWLRKQVNLVIYDGFSYLKGKQELHIIIPLEEVRERIKENVNDIVLESLPPELEGIPQEMVQFFLPQVFIEIDNQIPEQIEINETLLGTELTAQLHQAQQVVGYIKIGDIILISLAVLLILFIALLRWWRLKSIALYSGVPFIVAGTSTLIATLFARSLILRVVPAELPREIASFLPVLVGDIISPLRTYSLVILAIGIVLLVLSVIIKSDNDLS